MPFGSRYGQLGKYELFAWMTELSKSQAWMRAGSSLFPSQPARTFRPSAAYKASKSYLVGNKALEDTHPVMHLWRAIEVIERNPYRILSGIFYPEGAINFECPEMLEGLKDLVDNRRAYIPATDATLQHIDTLIARGEEYLASPHVKKLWRGLYARMMLLLYTGDAWESLLEWTWDRHLASRAH